MTQTRRPQHPNAALTVAQLHEHYGTILTGAVIPVVAAVSVAQLHEHYGTILTVMALPIRRHLHRPTLEHSIILCSYLSCKAGSACRTSSL